MPAYKLVYFNVKGRAEMTRLLFAAAGTKYEDCRVNGEEFQKLRDSGKLPFDKVPILEVDGKTLSQSINILQYVSRETGFSPKESFEIAKADMVVDGLSDISEKAIVFFTEKDEEKQKVLKKEYYEKLPNVMGKCEALLKSSGGKYFADNKLTYADIYFFSFLDTLFPDVLNKIPAVLESCPLLKDLFCRIRENPGIKEWLQTRPDQS